MGVIEITSPAVQIMVCGSFPDQYHRVGREVIKNKVDLKTIILITSIKRMIFNKRMHFNNTALHCYCNDVLLWY